MAKSDATTAAVPVVAPPKLAERFADESYKLFSKVQVEDPTPEEAKRLRKKCVVAIMPFLCLGYHLMFVDKQTVSRKC
jgi:hypothetical protein